jgi:hypothetical protein
MFSLQISLLRVELNLEGIQHLGDNVILSRDDSLGESVDWSHDELGESSSQCVSFGIVVFISPDLVWSIKEIVTPKLLHHFLFLNSEFLGISFSEEVQSETPTVLTRTEGNVTLSWVKFNVSHISIGIVLANDIGLLDNSLKRLVHIFRLHTKLHDGSVNLVDHEDWLDALLHSLSEDSLSLDADTLNTVDDDKSTVSDSKSGSDFRREVNVSWRVNKVEKIRLLFVVKVK